MRSRIVLAVTALAFSALACGAAGSPPEAPTATAGSSAQAPNAPRSQPSVDYAPQFKEMCTLGAAVIEEFGPSVAGSSQYVIWQERITPKLTGRASKLLDENRGLTIPAKQLYASFKEGAAELGVPNWECPALMELFARVQETYDNPTKWR